MTMFFDVYGRDKDTYLYCDWQETDAGKQHYMRISGFDLVDLKETLANSVANAIGSNRVYFREYMWTAPDKDFDTKKIRYTGGARFTVLKEEPIEIQI